MKPSLLAPTTRLALHLMLWSSLLAIGTALISQHVFDMRPCAWCVFQRLLFLVIALVAALGLLVGRSWPLMGRLACRAILLLSVGGIATAWYQYNVVANMFSCSQTFADRIMVGSGLDAALPWLFGIFATCADARVDLLGMEYALWSLALFVVLGVAAVAGVLAGRKTQRR